MGGEGVRGQERGETEKHFGRARRLFIPRAAATHPLDLLRELRGRLPRQLGVVDDDDVLLRRHCCVVFFFLLRFGGGEELGAAAEEGALRVTGAVGALAAR